MTRPVLPPKYVNVRADVTYSDQISAPLYRTYSRLVGLAWQDTVNLVLPQMEVGELLSYLALERSTFYGQLKTLREFGLVEWSSDNKGLLKIRILKTGLMKSVQNSGLLEPDHDHDQLIKDPKDIDMELKIFDHDHCGESVQETGLIETPCIDKKYLDAWRIILEQLRGDMSKASFETYVKETEILSVKGDQVNIGAVDLYSAEWCNNRLNSTINHIFAGIVNNPDIHVFFIVEQ